MSACARAMAALAVGTAASVAVACTSRTQPGPVVIYVVDAQRPDVTSAYGGELPTTPAAAELAREAVLYTNAFSVSTWTRPSVATLLTSVLPSRSATLSRWGRLDESVWYLPDAFRRKGWATAAFVSNGNLFDERLGFQRGWGVFRPIVHTEPGGKVPVGRDWHATAREVVDPALKWIEAQKSPRFFLYVHVVDTHAPYLLEPSYREMFSERAGRGGRFPLDYERAARQADDQFGRLVDALRARGFWAASTIAYTADHGEEFGEHGGSSHGQSVYEEQLRVPLLVRYPDGQGAGSRRPDPVSLADVTPTIAEIYGLEKSPEWIGTSLWRHRLPPERELYFTEDLDAARLYGVRRGPLKLIVQLYPEFKRTLFALDRDPQEQAGLDLPCGAEGLVDPQLLASLARWRQRDAATFPSLRFGEGATGGHCEASIDLSTVRKPFLTAEDHCRWSREITRDRLVYRETPGAPSERLLVSADDHGREPLVTFARGRARCSLATVKARFMEGELSEEQLERLKALGYFQAP